MRYGQFWAGVSWDQQVRTIRFLARMLISSILQMYKLKLKGFGETDFPDRGPGNSTGMSLEDRRALSIMEGTLEKDGGHFKLGLPWRDKSVSLPNNRVMAITRLAHLKRKLRGDPELRSMYKNTMKEYIGKGYAVPVNNTGKHESGKIWYLPHHPGSQSKQARKGKDSF